MLLAWLRDMLRPYLRSVPVAPPPVLHEPARARREPVPVHPWPIPRYVACERCVATAALVETRYDAQSTARGECETVVLARWRCERCGARVVRWYPRP